VTASPNSARDHVLRTLREGAELRLRVADSCVDDILAAGRAIETSLLSGGKVLLFGNGGSAADAQHIAAEFVGRLERDRSPLAALALTTDTSILTAIGNDSGFDEIFARQVRALGRRGDVAVGISTSGQSRNVIAGLLTAGQIGLITIAISAGEGGLLRERADLAILVPEASTAAIQECHIAIGHILCGLVEAAISGV